MGKSGHVTLFFGDTAGLAISASGLRGELGIWKIERSGELVGELGGIPGKSSLKGIMEAAMCSGEVGGLFAGVFFGLMEKYRCGERFLRDGEAERYFSFGGLRGEP